MKKLLVIAVMFVAFTQVQAQTKFGAQLDYSTSLFAGLGFGAHAEFFINDKMSIQPMFDYFLEKDFYSAWTISGDFHYYFSESGSMKIYGLGGLGYYSYTENRTTGLLSGFAALGIPVPSTSFSGVGLNLGAGATFGDSSVLPFAEAKFMSGISGLVLTVGVKFGGGN